MNTGHPIVGLARRPEKVQGIGAEIRKGDYDARVELQASLQGVDRLLLISGNQDLALRTEQHRDVIVAAQASGVRYLVFTSVQGIGNASEGSVGASFLQTEADVKKSGLGWVIGRNGVYIEPDVSCMASYARKGEIANSAADGRCGYTTRPELAVAYARLLLDKGHAGKTYNLNGAPLSQSDLARHMAKALGQPLDYRAMSPNAYLADRTEALGSVLGPIIANIYETIRNGDLNNPSDFEVAAGRAHISWDDFFAALFPDILRK